MIRLLFLLTLMALSACNYSKHISLPEINNEKIVYQPPVPERWMTHNGIEVLLLNDSELPLISGTLYTRQGSLSLTLDEQTIAAATGVLMRSAGAGSRTAQELDQELKDLSATVATGIGAENASFSFAGLAADREQIFKIFADVLLKPRFQLDRVELWKAQSIEGIKRRVEDPDTIATLAFNQLIYPNSHYGVVSTSAEVQAVSVTKLRNMHQKIVRPDHAILAISGAIERKDIDPLLEKYLASWKPRGNELPSPPELQHKPLPGIYLVERPLEQSTISMGQLGIRRLSPDHMPAVVFNQILSGGMGSRLMKKLRDEQGLAYSTYGSIFPGVVEGVNMVNIQTKASSTLTAIEQAIGVIQDLQNTEVSDAEFEETKRYISNSFVFRFADADALVNRYAMLDLMDYPKDFDVTYLDKIANITQSDVKSLSQRSWDPSKFVIFVVGNKQACEQVVKATNEGSTSILSGMPVKRLNFREQLEF